MCAACSGPSPRETSAPAPTTQKDAPSGETGQVEPPAVPPKLVQTGALYQGELAGVGQLEWMFREGHDAGGLGAPRRLSEATVAVDGELNGNTLEHSDKSRSFLDEKVALPRQFDVTIGPDGEHAVLSRVAVIRQWQSGSERAADFPDFVNGTPLQKAVSALLSSEAQAYAGEGGDGWGYRTSHVMCCARNLVSVMIESSESGGVHHITDTLTHTYVRDGAGVKEIALADLFMPGNKWQRTVSDLCIADLKRQFTNVEEHAPNDVISGTVAALSPKDLDAFVVTPKGLTFFLEPGVVGGGGNGSFTVAIPWNDLHDVLRPAGPVEFLTR